LRITVKETEYVAELARLKFSSEQLLESAKDLNDMLTYMNKLNEMDMDDNCIDAGACSACSIFREDEPRESLPREEALKNSPDRQEGYFRVPPAIEGQECI
jgi:aspartyl-tRNA(Asn)/glutamyl-tRNA(Gln) amidotransferase subunit C